MKTLSRAEKIAIINENQADFDGVFYYAVKTTGIFCRPSCRSRAPREENVRFFSDAASAVEAGYRPCKRCRPDLHNYSPQNELIQNTKAFIGKHFNEQISVSEIASAVGVSPYHLSRVFKTEVGVALMGYVEKMKLDHAARLLAETDNNHLEIALASGFQSASSFYHAFRRRFGVSPREYRRKKGVSGHVL